MSAVIVSNELLEAIEEGLNWMIGDFEEQTVVERKYRTETFNAEKFKRRKIDAETRKKVGKAVADEVEEVFPDVMWAGLENGYPMTKKGFIDNVRKGCDESWPLESDFLVMRHTLKRNGFYEGWDKWEDDEPYTDEYLQKTVWPECKRQIIARAKRDAPEIVAQAKEEYGDKYDAESFNADSEATATKKSALYSLTAIGVGVYIFKNFVMERLPQRGEE